ncbi:MMPL family transporter [Dactylosporangium aurantiacum]|uniref:MMPL family transporter n=1 Tax=Dactylosporangium aurantiacum TaxID=35754 RepID=A0A9Q9IT42_9ACTN|nr:MMPL family transporter [Dactylosporangium aurantiacum]MDG6103887.1 MMPL family transporter [Dactylosporangium aurantiacum]UWZ58920.1 MMPL family transporter [Dactylosporangium aurantiacum]
MSMHRLARLPSGRRTKFAMLALWVILVSALTPLALKLTDVQDNAALSALPDTAEAHRAAERVKAAFPTSDALVAVAVYARDTGLTAADEAKVAADRSAFARYAADGAVAEPERSADGKAVLVVFPLAGTAEEQSAAGVKVKELLAARAPDGLRTALTGTAGGDADLADAFAGMDVTLLLVTVAAVALLLLLTYRSPVLWLIPLLTAGVASQVASATVYLIVRHTSLTVDLQSQNIMTILVVGVGVDYALLLIARYREELRRHEDRHAAMAVALRRSLPAISASAATVTIGLLCLLAARLPATHGLGPVGAIAVVATLVSTMTLLPAVLVLCGRWVFWPFVPRFSAQLTGHDVARDHGVWARVAAFVGRWPRAIWIGTALVLAGLTAGIGSLGVGLPGNETYTKEYGSVTGQRLIEQHYPGGVVAPAVVVAAAGSADQVAAAARSVPGVAEVGAAQPSADRRWVRMEAVLAVDPAGQRALDIVERLRGAVHAVPGAAALVGGDTAYELDNRVTTDRDNVVVMPLILAAVLVVLVLLLRSLVAPLLLLVSVVVSYAAALGAAGLILDAIGHPDLWSPLPLQTFLFITALGVDYTIFLMTRAREESAERGTRAGVLHALTVTGGVITSAGAVLAATFTALTVLPLTPSVQTGVIVAAGVLIDTFLVRSLLIPALSVHLGRFTWWPGRLARRPAAAPEPAAPALVG